MFALSFFYKALLVLNSVFGAVVLFLHWLVGEVEVIKWRGSLE